MADFVEEFLMELFGGIIELLIEPWLNKCTAKWKGSKLNYTVRQKGERNMHRPKYTEELLRIIFLWLSAAFICVGLLCFIGVLSPKASSILQAPTSLGIAFSSIGIVYFVVQAVLKRIAIYKDELHNELLANGTRIRGTVEKVYLQKYTRYKNEFPYRILYTYSYQGKAYRRKTALLWEKPALIEGDAIKVYADKLGRSTVQL